MKTRCFSHSILLIAAMLIIAMAAQAQNATVTKVRQQYADAKQEIAKREQMKKDGQNPRDVLVVTSDYMAPGAGPIHEVINYYHSGSYDELLATVYYKPFFITRKYNVGAGEYYQEFLYDQTEDNNLTFFFQKAPDGETRYYWGANGLAYQAVKGEGQIDEVLANRLAYDLREAFNRLMNREF